MKYITIKRFKRNGIAAYFNIPYGATLELRDDDENGQERGKLSHSILNSLAPENFDTPKDRNDFWQVIWSDKLTHKYRRRRQNHSREYQ